MNILLGLLSMLALAAGTPSPKSAEIVGVWRGTSLCIRPAASPACKDERVVYRFSETAGASETVRLAAFKIVGGREDPMGDQDFRWDGSEGMWLGEFSNPRYHGLWRFRVEGGALTGELLLLPERTRVRQVAVKRD